MIAKWGRMYYLRKIGGLSLVALVAVMPSLAFADTKLTSQAYVDAQDALDEKLSNKLNGTSTSGQKIGDLAAGSGAGQDQTMYPSAAAVKEYAVKIAQGTGTNNANVGKTLVVDSSGNLELGSIDALPVGSANRVLQYNGTSSAWEPVDMDAAPTQSSVKPVTSGGVYNALQSATAVSNFVENAINSNVTDKAPAEQAVYNALNAKQDKQIGAAPVDTANSTDAGKILVVGNDGKIAVGVAVDTTPTQSSNNLVISGGVYDYAVPVHYGVGTDSANVNKGLIVNSSGNLALANILQAIGSPTTSITANDGYVVKSVVVNADGKTIDVTRDTVKIPVAAGAPSTNTPTAFAEVWVQ